MEETVYRGAQRKSVETVKSSERPRFEVDECKSIELNPSEVDQFNSDIQSSSESLTF